jgi:ABC-type transport system involved in multi-copper enzyme maturation permease subunit
MFRTIMIKEFLDNLLNLRFMVGLLVSVILTVACVMLQANTYSRRMQDYHNDIQQQEDTINKYGPISWNFNETPLIRPEALSPVAIGLSADDNSGFDANFLPNLFPFIDLVFVVSIIMSLLGILFSYDSICGEREQGTLKLVCSNNISRATILLGKWVGGTASLLIPFLISILMAAIYVALDPGVMWLKSDWAGFWALIAGSVSYISMFYLLGLMVSALSRNSSVSVLKSILLWILIVLVLPNLGPYVSSVLFPITSLVRSTKEDNQLFTSAEGAKLVKEMRKQMADLDKRYEGKYGELFKEYIAIPREKRLERTGMEAPDSDIKTMGLKYRQEYRAIQEKMGAYIQERREKIREQIKIEAERQTRVSKNIAAISPFADYIYLSADLAGTGMRSRENIERATSEFGALADKFSEEKAAEKDRKKISDWKNIKDNPLDISGRPRFSYEEEPLPARISVSLPYFGVMLLYGVLFFAIAFVGFIRYDVR